MMEKLSRKNFLTLAGLGGAGAVLAWRFTRGSDKWSFLERKIVEDNIYWREVSKKYVPIGPEVLAAPGSDLEFEVKKAAPEIREMVEKRIALGEFTGNKVQVLATWQNYVVPENREFAEQIVDYSKMAYEYLHHTLRDLEKKSVDWTIITPGSNYSEHFQGKAFIGHSYYTIHRIKVVNAVDPDQHFDAGDAHHQQGGFNHLKHDPETNEISWWHIFMGSGFTAIATPFSELIPVSTHRRGLEYAKTVGNKTATEVEEAISEGLSYHLGLRICQEFDIPNGVQYVEKLRRGIAGPPILPQYRYVGNAIRWIDKKGMQKALDLYLDDPGKFMEQLTKV